MVYESCFQSTTLAVLSQQDPDTSTFAGLIQVFCNWSHLVINRWINLHTCFFCVVCPDGRHAGTSGKLLHFRAYLCNPTTMCCPLKQQENSEWKSCCRKHHISQFPWPAGKDPSEGDFLFTRHRPLKYTQSGINSGIYRYRSSALVYSQWWEEFN